MTKRDRQAAEYAMEQPRRGALSGCEAVPDPDSRVWETHRTPQPHATQSQGSVQDEGSVPCSRTENEPVAWAVMERDGFGIEGTFTDRDEAAEWCDNRQEVVPLYRHPKPTLTDAEREAVEVAVFLVGLGDDSLHAATLRGLLERL